MVLQPIHDISELCARQGVREAILSPGSRCAPLTISFARHPEITSRIIIDERSAGFIAFGMAQKLRRPVVIICTSGTAALNLGPAIAEAYYQQVPLLVLTADRPPEWTDQQDGQTIRQQNIYGDHVKNRYQLPDHYDNSDVKWHIQRMISEAVNLSMEFPAGPVHVNVPLREPFYPQENEKPAYSEDIKAIKWEESDNNLSSEVWASVASDWARFGKILIVGGQRNFQPDTEDHKNLSRLADNFCLAGDVISNLHGVENVIRYQDIFLINRKIPDLQELQPDLLVTFGRSVISKNLKLFLRKYPAHEHWHIQPSGEVADTYQCLTRVIRTTESKFFKEASSWDYDRGNDNFRAVWRANEKKAKDLLTSFIDQADFGELKATAELIDSFSKIPNDACLHLANSMPVRLANFTGLGFHQQNIRVAANRGTSGIDGSNGTAVGEAIVSNDKVILLTGDLAFFYDRNAFWHNYNINNLKIIILNNHAGGIFGMIDGPSSLPELQEYFETSHPLNAGNTAKDFGIEYYYCNSGDGLLQMIPEFLENNNKPSLLEIETSNEMNKSIFRAFKDRVRNEFN